VRCPHVAAGIATLRRGDVTFRCGVDGQALAGHSMPQLLLPQLLAATSSGRRVRRGQGRVEARRDEGRARDQPPGRVHLRLRRYPRAHVHDDGEHLGHGSAGAAVPPHAVSNFAQSICSIFPQAPAPRLPQLSRQKASK